MIPMCKDFIFFSGFASFLVFTKLATSSIFRVKNPTYHVMGIHQPRTDHDLVDLFRALSTGA